MIFMKVIFTTSPLHKDRGDVLKLGSNLLPSLHQNQSKMRWIG